MEQQGKSKDQMIREKLIRQGKIIPNAAATKDVPCNRCGQTFQALAHRYDAICGSCSTLKARHGVRKL